MSAAPARKALQLGKRALEEATTSAIATVDRSTVRSYWWRSVPNFGDRLQQVILAHFGWRPRWTSPSRAQLVGVGSILERLPASYEGIVAGSGLMFRESRRSFPRATILAVRGPLTSERLGLGREVPMGDPALMVSQMFEADGQRNDVIGIIAHHSHRDSKTLGRLKSRVSDDIVVIDVGWEPSAVVEAANGCSRILSSSLHGIIIADALGIPNGWIRLGDDVGGGSFKFEDYAASVGAPHPEIHVIDGAERIRHLISLVRPPAPLAKERAHALAGIYAQLATWL